MTEKQFTGFVAKMEEMPLPALDKLVKRLYETYLKRCARGTEQLVADKIKLCLYERKQRLNKGFVFTADNVIRIGQINEKLIHATQKLLDKTTEINQQMREIMQTADGFLHDYSIEATLNVKWEETDNVIDEVLDEFSGLPLRNFYVTSGQISTSDSIDNSMDAESWNEEELSAPELSEIPFFPYAAHSLFCHSYYSYTDCIAIRAFRNEVNVCWVNKVEIE